MVKQEMRYPIVEAGFQVEEVIAQHREYSTLTNVRGRSRHGRTEAETSFLAPLGWDDRT